MYIFFKYDEHKHNVLLSIRVIQILFLLVYMSNRVQKYSKS